MWRRCSPNPGSTSSTIIIRDPRGGQEITGSVLRHREKALVPEARSVRRGKHAKRNKKWTNREGRKEPRGFPLRVLWSPFKSVPPRALGLFSCGGALSLCFRSRSRTLLLRHRPFPKLGPIPGALVMIYRLRLDSKESNIFQPESYMVPGLGTKHVLCLA